MRALEKNTPPLVEARALVQMLKSGIETPQSVVALMRIPSSHKRHLNADELWYRAAVEAHFWNIVRPGSRVVPKRPWERPVEELPGRRPVPKAKAKHVTVPTVDPARVVAHVAAHYGVAETDLTAPRRRKKVGV